MLGIRADSGDKIVRYFRKRAEQMLSASDQSICDHGGLSGSHRETLCRKYLGDIIPKRFEISRGMVYGPIQRSREADVVVWDAQNYPSLPLEDHSFFFAEAVKAVIEVKSVWSTDNFKDIGEKSEAIHAIMMNHQPSVWDSLNDAHAKIHQLETGNAFSGFLIAPHRIGMAAIVLSGGQSLTADTLPFDTATADTHWPDLLLLLEAGKVAVKDETSDGLHGTGQLLFYDAGEDALLLFTAHLMAMVHTRSVAVQDPLFLLNYIFNNTVAEPAARPYEINRFLGSKPLFSRPLDDED